MRRATQAFMPRVSLALLLFVAACAAPVPEERCEPPTVTIEEHFETNDLDLLFVVDDSPSMAREAEHLALEIPRIALRTAIGDFDGDGRPDYDPASRTHAAVISTDLGGSSLAGSGCEGWGDDGLLQPVPAGASPSCDASSVRAFSSITRGGDAVTFSNEIGCAARVGSTGCTVEQPLEAMLRALSVDAPTTGTRADYVPPVFRDGTFGHGSGANRGFLGETSALAIVVITNEDDCSVADVDAELDGREDAACSGRSRLPISRFVDGLIGLRRLVGDLAVGVIAGVPSRLAGVPYDRVLADPSMQSDEPAHASCTSDDGRMATAPRRLVELLSQLEDRGVSTVLTSICDSELGDPFELLEHGVERAHCLPVDDDEVVDCEATFTLAPPSSELPLTRCDQIPGAELVDVVVGVDGSGERTSREVCRVPPVTPEERATGLGWFRADEPYCRHTIRFARPIEGSDARITCRRLSVPLVCAGP